MGKPAPPVLYHYTSEMYLGMILTSGHLRLTESNIGYDGSGPRVVWLTTTRDPGGNGLDGGFGKGRVKITIDASGLPLHHWPTWSFEQGIEPVWYDALDSAGGGGSENWWVCTREIPLGRFLSIEVDGVPVHDFAKGRIGSLQSTGSIREYIGATVMMRKMMRERGQIPKDWKHTGIDDLILANGRDFTKISKDLPEGVERGKMGDCYANAFTAAMENPDLIYVEGYAEGGAFMPLAHAWVVDKQGTVYDPTWTKGTAYFGVPLQTSFVGRVIARAGYYSVFGGDFAGKELQQFIREGLPSNAIRRVGSLATEAMPVGPIQPDVTYDEKKAARANIIWARCPTCSAEGHACGFIRWYSDGEIAGVKVVERHRRRGLATELLRRARAFQPNVHHSETLSDDGAAWSQVAASLQSEASGMFAYSDEDVAAHIAENPNVTPTIIDGGEGFIALWRGMPVGQITYTLEQDENVYSDEDGVWQNAKGDHNGYHWRIEMLVVSKAARRRGIGTLLLNHFIAEATKRFAYGTDPKSQKGFDPGNFTRDGAAIWKAVMGETVPVTQRSTYSSLHEAAMGEGWTINGKPYTDGVWIEVEPDVWYRGADRGEIPHRAIVRLVDGKWAWEAETSTFIGAPNERKPRTGTSKTLEEAQAKALASTAKDQEFFERYQERMNRSLSAESLWSSTIPHLGSDQKVEVSGVALVARDTGRVLFLQRALTDNDDNGGKWEFPGGHHEDGDTTSLHAAIREWEEEVGQRFPEGGEVINTWTSADGIYRGHVVAIDEEAMLALHVDRVVDNPDEDGFEQAAWWTIDDARKNPALREECKKTPWDLLKVPVLDKTAHKEGSTMDTPDEFGSLFDEIPADPMPDALAPTASVQHTSDWGFDLPYDNSPGVVWASPNAPHPGLGHTMEPGFEGFIDAPASVSWTLDEDPEAALPVTYGETEDEDALAQQVAASLGSPNHTHTISRQPISPHSHTIARQQPQETEAERGRRLLAYADALARGETPPGPNPFAHVGATETDNEMAAAAQTFLATKTALRTYDPAERQAIIDEGIEVRAGNLDRLDIKGTHYEALVAAGREDEDLTFLDGDPNLSDF